MSAPRGSIYSDVDVVPEDSGPRLYVKGDGGWQPVDVGPSIVPAPSKSPGFMAITAPPRYTHVQFPKRNGVFYTGDTPSVRLLNAGASAYTVRDYYGNVVSSGPIPVAVPPMSQSDDLAIAGISWFNYPGPDLGPDTGPTFTPGGAGTNHFGTEDISPYRWKVSSSSLQLASTDPITFSTTLDVGATTWTGGVIAIKSAHPASAAVAHATVATGAVVTIPATSTDNMLCLYVGTLTPDPSPSVTDDGGNAWTGVKVASGVYADAWFFYTTAAHPASVTQVTFHGLGTIAGAIYEISGAQNTDPVDSITGTGSDQTFAFGPAAAIPLTDVTTVTPAAPAGGWKFGWYRIYFHDEDFDPEWGDSDGATNFLYIPTDARFVPMPPVGTYGGAGGEARDLVMKGVLGIGTSRLQIGSAADPTSGIDSISAVETDIPIANTYWANPDTPYVDPIRSRPLMVSFPNAGTDTAWSDGVTALVAALYPLGITHFEGPYNEPNMSGAGAANTASLMATFQAAVHAGHASAKAIGPTAVTVDDMILFLNAGGGAYCDELSFHDYSSAGGNLTLSRAKIETFVASLVAHGLTGKALWQTEAGYAFQPVFGVYHARSGALTIMHALLWEQYGLPRERNLVWYDRSHGFWDIPAFLEAIDTSLQPICAMYRTLATETFGMAHATRLNFGTIGEHIFLGSVFQAPAANACVALMATSAFPEGTITLTITGSSSPLTVVDVFGNTSTVTIVNGRATVPVTGEPTYVRLPTGVSASVYSCNNWPPVSANEPSKSATATGTIGGVTSALIGDGLLESDYATHAGVVTSTLGLLPDTAQLEWSVPQLLDRLVVFAAMPAQTDSTLVDFDVQTTVDGTTWVTAATVTKEATSFLFGTDSTNMYSQRETYWPAQWIFDIPLPTIVNALGVRVYARTCSYGGEPDAASVKAGGEGSPTFGSPNPTSPFSMQEIVTVCDEQFALRFTPDMFWWDPADNAHISLSGSNITGVGDKTGNGYNLTPHGVPVLGTINGVQAIDFGSGACLNSPNFAIGQPYTFYFIVKASAATITALASHPFFLGGIAGSAAGFGSPSGSFWGMSFPTILASTTTPDTNPHVLTVIANGGASVIKLDNVVIASGFAGSGGWNDQVVLGAGTKVGAQPWLGLGGDAMGFHAAHSVSQQLSVYAFLAHKWSTP